MPRDGRRDGGDAPDSRTRPRRRRDRAPGPRPPPSQRKKFKCLVLGLQGAGKTSFLHKVARKVVTSTPAPGFEVETVRWKKLSLVSFDIKDAAFYFELWKTYYEGAWGIVFVVDATDVDRIAEAKEDLGRALDAEAKEGVRTKFELGRAALLVLANKQTLPNALPSQRVAELLGLDQHTTREWKCQDCDILTGDGVFEGLNWLMKASFDAEARAKKGLNYSQRVVPSG